MLRPTMFVLCLIAVLAGTPLRQAEAVADFARSHGEIEQGSAIELIDGGVGDDSEVAISRAGDDSHSLPATALPESFGATVPPFLPPSSPPTFDHWHRANQCASFHGGSAGRLAWLQCFLL